MNTIKLTAATSAGTSVSADNSELEHFFQVASAILANDLALESGAREPSAKRAAKPQGENAFDNANAELLPSRA